MTATVSKHCKLNWQTHYFY